jgi:hypothetical protein
MSGQPASRSGKLPEIPVSRALSMNAERSPVRIADFVQVESPPLEVSEHYGVFHY